MKINHFSIYLRLSRQWFNWWDVAGGHGRFALLPFLTPPLPTANFWVSNHLTHWYFLCCVDRCVKVGCSLIARVTTSGSQDSCCYAWQHQPSNTTLEVFQTYLIMYSVRIYHKKWGCTSGSASPPLAMTMLPTQNLNSKEHPNNVNKL